MYRTGFPTCEEGIFERLFTSCVFDGGGRGRGHACLLVTSESAESFSSFSGRLSLCPSVTDCHLKQGSPTPGPQTGTRLQPGRNKAAQQEVSGRQVKLHLPLPIARITA